MRIFHLRDVCACSPEDQAKLLEVRNRENVRRAMYTDRLIPAEEHARYIGSLQSDENQCLYVVLADGTDVAGAVSLSRIDRTHRKCDWAFYLDDGVRGGVGSALEVFALDHVFDRLDLEKLNCEVIETNPAVVKMHLKFGFVEEGFRRQNIVKDGLRVGVHLLGMTRDEWRANRPGIVERLGDRLGTIEIRLEGRGA